MLQCYVFQFQTSKVYGCVLRIQSNPYATMLCISSLKMMAQPIKEWWKKYLKSNEKMLEVYMDDMIVKNCTLANHPKEVTN